MSTEFRYEVIIYWSDEDHAFIAEVPELPGCAADGKSYEQALSNVKVIIDEWIETAKELGRPVPEPRGRLMFAQLGHAGDREVRIALRKTLFKYQLHQDNELFDWAYGYIREYY